MIHPFNKLTNAEDERLALLLEELGEAVQAVGKVLRHGYGSANPEIHPDEAITNRMALEQELGQVLAAMRLLTDANDLDAKHVESFTREKLARVRRYLHHQG